LSGMVWYPFPIESLYLWVAYFSFTSSFMASSTFFSSLLFSSL